jgi:hypothetical protein
LNAWRGATLSVLAVVTALALIASACAHGSASADDPFAGIWTTGQKGSSSLVIRHAAGGYALTMVTGKYCNGWMPLSRKGNTLTARLQLSGGPKEVWEHFAYDPASRLLAHDVSGGIPVSGIVLHRTSSATSAPPLAPSGPDTEW